MLQAYCSELSRSGWARGWTCLIVHTVQCWAFKPSAKHVLNRSLATPSDLLCTTERSFKLAQACMAWRLRYGAACDENREDRWSCMFWLQGCAIPTCLSLPVHIPPESTRLSFAAWRCCRCLYGFTAYARSRQCRLSSFRHTCAVNTIAASILF